MVARWGMVTPIRGARSDAGEKEEALCVKYPYCCFLFCSLKVSLRNSAGMRIGSPHHSSGEKSLLDLRTAFPLKSLNCRAAPVGTGFICPRNPLRAKIHFPVLFFIHPTFRNDGLAVNAVNGEAVLRLRARGAFTVGVMADDGNIKLELDLAELQGAPMEFRNR